MVLLKISPNVSPVGTTPAPRANLEQLLTALFGDLRHNLPYAEFEDILPELTSAVTSLVEGKRPKALLPLGASSFEVALVRNRHDIHVSLYDPQQTPVIFQLNRRVSMRELASQCVKATARSITKEQSEHRKQLATRVVERAQRAELATDSTSNAPILRSFGLSAPDKALGFGFEASFRSPRAQHVAWSHALRADAHSLLFNGRLWAWVRGKRVPLASGPIMVVAQEMLTLLTEALSKSKTCKVFRISTEISELVVRFEKTDDKSFFLIFENASDLVKVRVGQIQSLAEPVLELCARLLRALVASDRCQLRNLRVISLRQKVRNMKKRLKKPNAAKGFVSRETNVIPWKERESGIVSTPSRSGKQLNLRYRDAWQISLEGVDANRFYLCGDKLVLNTHYYTMALCRDQGDVLWARDSVDHDAFVVGRTLVRANAAGDIDLCELSSGDSYAHVGVDTSFRGDNRSPFVATGGVSSPSVIMVPEKGKKLSAVDVRTGQLRWRTKLPGAISWILPHDRFAFVSTVAGTLHAMDTVTGDELWRFVVDGSFQGRPTLSHKYLLVAAVKNNDSKLMKIDLRSGELLSEPVVPGMVSTSIEISGNHAVFGSLADAQTSILGCNVERGEIDWSCQDPGWSIGASALCVDDLLILNCGGVKVSAIDCQKGETRWENFLGEQEYSGLGPMRCEPVLRGGALFVPGMSVNLIQPWSGVRGTNTVGSLVPDALRVDERAWVYLADESGALSAHTPIANLRLL